MKSFLKRVLVFGLMFFAINYIFDFFYSMPNRKAIAKGTHKIANKWKDMHDGQEKYDILILGSSRSFTGYNPKIIDSVLGGNSYNMGTPSQDIAETYYVLKEILCYQKPKVILLDNFIESLDRNINYYPILSNASFMECDGNKYGLIIKGFGVEGLANEITPILKYKYHLKNDLTNLFKGKGKSVSEDENSWYKGFEINSTIITPKEVMSLGPIPNLTTTNVDKTKFEYYCSKIYQLAEENNAKLIALRTPYPPHRMEISRGDDVHDYYAEFYKSKNVVFIDFNYTAEPVIKNEDFSDFHHLNIFGANKVTRELCKLIAPYF
ncbi:hypothetical protein [Flagellimonas iocasae]|uniref:SGNH/GDSL hydrolase family protein n=1 Tax=Flagellimonas iocasae TaxID=2055905 RepID=A0ABW4XTJ0_9FLAO